jgi:hypothetical protein
MLSTPNRILLRSLKKSCYTNNYVKIAASQIVCQILFLGRDSKVKDIVSKFLFLQQKASF